MKQNIIFWIVGVVVVLLVLNNYNPDLFAISKCGAGRCNPFYIQTNGAGCMSSCGISDSEFGNIDSCDIQIVSEYYDKYMPNQKVFSDSRCTNPLATYVCVNKWSCSSWKSCSNGKQTRTCTDSNNCGNNNNKPEVSKSCTSPCKPSCTGKKCGADDGCGGQCTSLCTQSCIPNCKDKYCGSDGCGGSCGDCSTSTAGSVCRSNKCSYQMTKDTVISTQFTSSLSQYNTARKKARIPDKYVYETNQYDYNALYNLPGASKVKSDILFMAQGDPRHAALAVAKVLREKVKYDMSITKDPNNPWLQECESSKASEIYESGTGICSTMSRTAVAMLRGIGLAARATSGCVVNGTVTCNSLLWAITGGKEIEANSYLDPSGRYIIAGRGLHAWVEVWLPDTGWTILEPTGGFLVSKKCKDYYSLANEDSYTNEINLCGMSGSKAQICKNMK